MLRMDFFTFPKSCMHGVLQQSFGWFERWKIVGVVWLATLVLKLLAEHEVVFFDRKNLAFGLEMISCGHEDTSGDGAKGTVLAALEVVPMRVRQLRGPNRCSIIDEAAANGFVSCGEYLLVLSP